MRAVFVRRIVWWGAVAAVVVGLVIWAMRPQPVAVDADVVTRGALQVTLDQEGRTRARQTFVVSAPVTGRLLRVGLEPGDPVTRGAEVARLLPTPAPLLDVRTRETAEARVQTAAAGVEQARAALAQARAALEFAEAERARMARLFEGKAVSERDLQAAATEARVRQQAVNGAEASVAAAEHDLQAARAALTATLSSADAGAVAAVPLRAPIAGVVLRRLHESETVVVAGEPIVEIADVSNLEVVADYLSTDAVRIAPGMPAVIDRWGGGEPLRGHVRRVEPVAFVKVSALGVEEQRVNVIVDFDDPEGAWRVLGDGYRVDVHVVEWEAPDVLKVPSSALFRYEEDWAAFVIGEDGRVTRRAVDIGRDTGLEAEVGGGLREGERVVLHPSDRVVDGVLVASR
jgi:HlyD family secretion protein